MNKTSSNNETATDVYTVLADAVFRPILFSTPMVQAILEGRKTQTRRIIKSKHESGLFQVCKNLDGKVTEITSLDWDECPKNDCTNDIKPLANIGDILWVRETFAKMFDIHEELVGKDKEDMGYWYKTDGELSEASFYIEGYKWKPSIFMPKEACRIFLEVTDVRVERLQHISLDDARAEGVEIVTDWTKENALYQYRNYLKSNSSFLDSQLSFKSLWQSINREKSWEENPFVFVYDFKRVERPLGFC